MGAATEHLRLRAILMMTVSVLLVAASGAEAAPSGTTHPLPHSMPAGVARLCGPSPAYVCTTAGYTGKSTGWWGAKYGAGYASANQFGYHNCTLYAAFRVAQNGLGDPGWSDNANGWDTKAWNAGTHVDQSPALGSVAQWNTGLGHVAYVEAVTADYIELTDDNYGSNVTDRWRIARSSSAWPDNFIHLRDLATSPPSPPPPPPDADGDGVPDGEDHCPSVAGDSKDGCPSIAGVPFDANRDGRYDLVHRWSGGVNTWLSKGDGGYEIRGQGAPPGYGFTDGTWFAADASGDERTDLVHRWSQGVNTWLSNGDGTYAIRSQQAQPGYGYTDGAWFAADSNGDGRTDLIHRWSQGVNTWTSNGDGTYAIRGQQAQPGYGYTDGAWFAADSNGDGRTDLIHRWSQGVNTWTSNGDGTYAIRGQQAQAGYGYGQGVWFAADNNGDGQTDLVHRWSQGVNTWLSNGDGTYAIRGQQAQAGYGYGQGVWFAADSNGDGRTDLIHRWDLGVNTWLAKGDGTYDIRGQQAQAGYGYGQGVWFAADSNGDGRTDLIHRWDLGVNTWLAKGDGTYDIRGQGAQPGYGFGNGQWPASVYSLTLLRRPPVTPAPTGADPGSSGPAPAPGAGVKPSATVRCVVPKLKGLTVKRATKRLRARHCRLGKVRRGKGGRRAVVVRQSRRAGRRLERGTRIDVRLGRPARR